MRFKDHYAQGVKDSAKLPRRVRQFPTLYRQELLDRSRKYADHVTESMAAAGIAYDCHVHGWPRDEYECGLEDALYKSPQQYAVFAWRGDGKYEQAPAVSPFYCSSSLARKWLTENMTYDEHMSGNGGHGFVVRGVAIRS